MISCTSRDEINLIAAIFSRNLAPETSTIVRTTNEEYLEVWRERQLDVDFMVSSELETANAVSRIIGLPAARQTDVFADGQVQIVEFDVVGPEPTADGIVGVPLREARIPRDSKVAGIIRGDRMILPRGDQTIEVGDRVVIIGSPEAARIWGDTLSRGQAAARRHRALRGGPHRPSDRPRARRPGPPRADHRGRPEAREAHRGAVPERARLPRHGLRP